MGGGYGNTVASVKESSLAALPESPWLGTDGFAKGSAIAASARLSNKLAGDRSGERQSILQGSDQALSVAAWARGLPSGQWGGGEVRSQKPRAKELPGPRGYASSKTYPNEAGKQRGSAQLPSGLPEHEPARPRNGF